MTDGDRGITVPRSRHTATHNWSCVVVFEKCDLNRSMQQLQLGLRLGSANLEFHVAWC